LVKNFKIYFYLKYKSLEIIELAYLTLDEHQALLFLFYFIQIQSFGLQC